MKQKKLYLAPEMQVVELRVHQTLLTVSGDATRQGGIEGMSVQTIYQEEEEGY